MNKTLHCKILVCCHKKDIMLTCPPFSPIQVGTNNSTLRLNIQGDNTKDNISDKNPSYCELTGIYWAWKNLKDIDIIGFCHYRRYFDFHQQCKPFLPYTNFRIQEFDKLNFSIPQKILEYVQNKGVIVPRCNNYEYSLFVDYCRCHISDDLRTLETIIKSTTDSKYANAFDQIMHWGHKLRPYNMFIMNWKEFDKYCNWLFPILKLCEEQLNISQYNNYQKRVFGYMGERLFNIYLYAEKLKFKEFPIICFNETLPQENKSVIKYKFNCIKNNIAFYITKK